MALARRPVSPFPLYFKVMMEIRENILSEEWAPGAQIPGEMDLAQRLGVSVITIRQALGQLVHEGYVRRERAKWTFVNWKGPVRQSANLEVEADDLVTVDRASTRFKLISIDPVAPSKEIRRKLPLGAVLQKAKSTAELGEPNACFATARTSDSR